ncbi:hypothetical protein SK128_007449 [Halocaridina rubra]|uniref:Uncharacterized protein n=1 Tax=Halocaridina rubra TaxID=373956 RepID=A0AAN8XF85_HALRR
MMFNCNFRGTVEKIKPREKREKMTMLIKAGKDIIDSHPDVLLEIPYAHWLIKADDGIWSDEERGTTKCPTLQECLGYQACLFNYGIEFCHMDPVPGQRKVSVLSVGAQKTCYCVS